MTTEPLLDEVAGAIGSRREAAWLLEELDGVAPEERRCRAMALAERRRGGEPLQYVVGHWAFRGLDLAVDARALIPRPETEPMVDLALAALGRFDGPMVACDLGCGTGAIALSIAVEGAALGLDVVVHATDASTDALELARHNVARVGARGVELHEGSWFDALPRSLEGSLQVVCANPPYVAAADRPALARELDFEPDVALVAPDADDGTPGFGSVAAVIGAARRWLAPGATVLVEHGATHRDAAVRCAREAGLVDVVDHDDLAELPRILEARRAP